MKTNTDHSARRSRLLIAAAASMVSIFALGLVTFPFTTPARAGSHSDCAAYGKTAVRQQRKNLREGCGFSGPRWHDNEQAHYGWCRIARSRTARKEIRGRRDSLNNCIARANNGNQNAGVNQVCQDHADMGVDSQRTNRELGCGLRGSKWSSSFQKHYKWCKRKGRGSRNRRQTAWDDALNDCADNQNNRNNGGGNRNADACGWYVILDCHRDRGNAEDSLDRLGGSGVGGGAGTNVIRTGDYDGFRGGWYCVADGPYSSKGRANGVAWKEYYPSAYSKRGCKR